MRNYWEGHHTLWHMDIAYPHLRPTLQRLCPTLTTLPTVAEAQEWHRRYEQYVALLRAPEEQRTPAQCVEAELLQTWLHDTNAAWAPPPHLRAEATPVAPMVARALTNMQMLSGGSPSRAKPACERGRAAVSVGAAGGAGEGRGYTKHLRRCV